MPFADIPYDTEDFGMEAAELEAKYGDTGHPEYGIQKWRDCPVQEDVETNGYWDWVRFRIEQDDESTPSYA